MAQSYKKSQMEVIDDPRSEHLVTARTDENVKRFRDVMSSGRRLSIQGLIPSFYTQL